MLHHSAQATEGTIGFVTTILDRASLHELDVEFGTVKASPQRISHSVYVDSDDDDLF